MCSLQPASIDKSSIRGSKTHLVHDGAVARIGVQKIKSRVALQEYQPGRPLPVTLLQIEDRLFFASERRIGINEFGGWHVFFAATPGPRCLSGRKAGGMRR